MLEVSISNFMFSSITFYMKKQHMVRRFLRLPLELSAQI